MAGSLGSITIASIAPPGGPPAIWAGASLHVLTSARTSTFLSGRINRIVAVLAQIVLVDEEEAHGSRVERCCGRGKLLLTEQVSLIRADVFQTEPIWRGVQLPGASRDRLQV